MITRRKNLGRSQCGLRLGIGFVVASFIALRLLAADARPDAELLELSGVAKHKPRDKPDEYALTNKAGLYLFAGDRFRTLANSHATIGLLNRNPIKLGPKSVMEIVAPPGESSLWLNLLRGTLYFFSREKPRDVQVRMPHATGAHQGTEFVVIVEEQRSLLAVYDGEASLTNDFGGVVLKAGELGVARDGAAPVKMALKAENIVEWWLFYPAVLDADDLDFNAGEQSELKESLRAYRAGDLPAAFSSYPGSPAPVDPDTDAGRIYLAELLLSAGQVEGAEALLSKLGTNSSPAEALRWIIAAVQGKVDRPPEIHTSASEWLGLSYYFQARHELTEALRAARQAVELSPDFGFGWARVAELEFSHAHVPEAQAALDRSLQLAPRNAQAHALKGFLLSARGQLAEARAAFEHAIELNSSLGNAWLGRGLIRIRTGDAAGGRMDLQTAVVLEPKRSLLRSYLGKAFSDAGRTTNAASELHLAKELDGRDPTPWLYSALLNEEQNRLNEAVAHLEKSIALNDNRAVYRSRFLLDEDRAVRSSSLANLYQNAGMPEVSVREAARAVSYDYANYSAHLFLAESFNALRDPTRFNLRHETVWFNELLLANLLSPVGGTPLSQHVSQQEYSRLFERDRVGLTTATEYRSDGQWLETVSQFGNIGKLGWALDLEYQHNDGVRPNNELDRIEWYSQLKYQLTPNDALFLLAKYQDYRSGDNFQYFDWRKSSLTNSTSVRTNFSFDEFQTPLLAAGYHHEWQPGVHTLFLGARLENDQRFYDAGVNQLLLATNPLGQVVNALTLGLDDSGMADNGGMDVWYRGRLEIYSAELNQIFQDERQTLIVGGRYQGGGFKTDNLLTNVQPTNAAFVFQKPPASNSVSADFERLSAYAYYTLKPIETLLLTVGLAYDQITFPLNHRSPPISAGEDRRDQLSPKAAVVWSPSSVVTMRGAYSRSLGGVSFDESFRLEPTQLAGFSQAFRTIISESVAGGVSAPSYEVIGGALDLKFPTRTYLGLEGGLLSSEVRRTDGAFGFDGVVASQRLVPFFTREELDYQETSLALTLNQLVGRDWSFGAQFKLTRSELHTVFPDIPVMVLAGADRMEQANLREAGIFALFNHPSGFFARADVHWYHQYNSDYETSDFYQCNLFAGWRLRRQRGEVSVGVLNLNDTDYRLNPLNPYAELPRERTFVARLKLNF